MSTVTPSKHDIKNIFVKVMLSSDFDVKEENTRKYLEVLRNNQDLSTLELSLRDKIKSLLNKFKYEEIG